MATGRTLVLVDEDVPTRPASRLVHLDEVRQCVECGESFRPYTCCPDQQTCGARLCQCRRYDRRRLADPAYIRLNRERNREARRRRGLRLVRHPWLYGAPPYAGYLPGGGAELYCDPPLPLRLEHQHLYMLHAALTQIVGEPHEQHRPQWSLVPWYRGVEWAVCWHRDDLAERLCGTSHPARVGREETVLRFGPRWHNKPPRIERRGHRLVRLDAITPVCSRRAGSSATYTAPGAGTLTSTLVRVLAPRLGLDYITEQQVCMRVRSRETEARSVWCGPKIGVQRGWVGHVTLECNAVAHWLLEAAARGPGLGGRTALGFGRVVVEGCRG